MYVSKLPFRSVKDPRSSMPWYQLEVDEQVGEVRVVEDSDGSRNFGLENAATQTPDHVDLPERANRPTAGQIQYAVTEAGEFVAFDPDDPDTAPNLRITLGWYFEDGGVHYHDGKRLEVDPDTLLLLDFMEA